MIMDDGVKRMEKKQMEYMQFKERLKEALQEHFLGRGEVYYDKGKKTNDTDKEAVIVRPFRTMVQATIYTEDMYEGYKYTRDFEKLGRLQVVPGTVKISAYNIFMIYLINGKGEIVWSFQPMGDYDSLYSLRSIMGRDVDGDECFVAREFVVLSEQLPKAMTITEVRYGEGVSDVRVDMVQYACQFIGNRYVWGGTSLTDGIDCSGFVMRIYEKYGIYLPHYSGAQAGYGTKIDASEARPGDLTSLGAK